MQQQRFFKANFSTFIWSVSLNTIGDGARTVALPLLATTLTSSATSIAAISAATMLPWLLFSLPAGMLVDRLNKWSLIMLSSLAQCAVVLLVLLFFVIDILDMELLIILSFILGSLAVVHDCARETLVPDIPLKIPLASANGRITAYQSFSGSIVGKALGGTILSFSFSLALSIYALALLTSSLILPKMKFVNPKAVPLQRANWKREFTVGIGALLSDKLLLVITFSSAVLSMIFFGQIAILPLLTSTSGDFTFSEYGYLLAFGSLGGVLGSVSARNVEKLIGCRASFIIDIALILTSSMLIFIQRDSMMIWPCFFITSFAILNWTVLSTTLRQKMLSRELLGRVTGAHRLLSWGARPIGAMMFGLIASRWDIYVAFGMGAFLALLILICSSSIILIDDRLSKRALLCE